jgi:hypothetical protein
MLPTKKPNFSNSADIPLHYPAEQSGEFAIPGYELSENPFEYFLQENSELISRFASVEGATSTALENFSNELRDIENPLLVSFHNDLPSVKLPKFQTPCPF